VAQAPNTSGVKQTREPNRNGDLHILHRSPNRTTVSAGGLRNASDGSARLTQFPRLALEILEQANLLLTLKRTHDPDVLYDERRPVRQTQELLTVARAVQLGAVSAQQKEPAQVPTMRLEEHRLKALVTQTAPVMPN
jgi:hypothetical protein